MIPQFFYGVEGGVGYRDITFACCVYFLRDHKISIPADFYKRVEKIGDHVPPNIPLSERMFFMKYQNEIVRIPWGIQMDFTFEHLTNVLLDQPNYNLKNVISNENLNLKDIHEHARLLIGSMKDELPEQELALEFIQPDDRVIELGGNVGRNTIVISCILTNPHEQLVSLECNQDFIQMFEFHKKINGLTFHIENSALSKRPLYIRDWETTSSISSNDHDYKIVNTMSWSDLVQKYFTPTVLVADCEGALYSIFRDDSHNILSDLRCIIMENDYHDLSQYEFIQQELLKHHFICKKSVGGGWGPCASFFYQVWIKK